MASTAASIAAVIHEAVFRHLEAAVAFVATGMAPPQPIPLRVAVTTSHPATLRQQMRAAGRRT
ncbi:hypothetical protein GEU84_012275 [Fertoebacter nigrum]|uniref:Uncharacterized protein n=1 Tax=Fertoeibacter niger TaxID=2656921 RepID=A0A8X8GVN8_9RHOB|nr:hypothetical protein [Fertoeibacter niger]NUB45168.1 hypothetical protein [Fertoeibacter niger]